MIKFVLGLIGCIGFVIFIAYLAYADMMKRSFSDENYVPHPTEKDE